MYSKPVDFVSKMKIVGKLIFYRLLASTCNNALLKVLYFVHKAILVRTKDYMNNQLSC